MTIATPIITTSSFVYVAAPVTRSSTQQSCVASLNKSTWATVEDVQIRAATHDSNIGHRGASVGAAGSDLFATAGYNTTWGEKHSATNLSALAASTNPTGSTGVSYYQYSVDPNNGDIYVTVRAGNTEPRSTRIYKWTAGAWVLWSTVLAGGGYMSPLAFATDGTVYAAGSFAWTGADSGHPKSHGSIIKTTDDGSTWQDLAGNTVTLPLSRTNPGTPVFWPGTFNIIRLAVDGNDDPVAFCSFDHPDMDVAELWQATWNGTYMEHRQLQDHTAGTVGIGDVSVAYHAGTIVVTVGEFDTIDDPVNGAQAPHPSGKLWLFASDDDAATWTRYELHDADVSNGYSGAYLDPRSLAVDGVVRMIPTDLVTPANHEVWELTLP